MFVDSRSIPSILFQRQEVHHGAAERSAAANWIREAHVLENRVHLHHVIGADAGGPALIAFDEVPVHDHVVGAIGPVPIMPRRGNGPGANAFLDFHSCNHVQDPLLPIQKLELSFGNHLGDHAHPLIRLQAEAIGVLAVDPDLVLRLKRDVAPVIGDSAGLAAMPRLLRVMVKPIAPIIVMIEKC